VPLVYDHFGSGHRANYVRLFARLVGGEAEIGRYWHNWLRLLLCRSLVLPSFDGEPRRNLAIAVVRVLLRRPTAVLLLRAHLIGQRRRLAHFAHSLVLRFLGTSRQILPLSIVGSDELRRACPNVEVIVDPEFWDYEFMPRAPHDKALIEEVQRRAGDRRILLIAGGISRDKAIDELAQIFTQEPCMGELFCPILAGTVHPDSIASCAFVDEHGWHIESGIDDATFRQLFELADFAWCAYRLTRNMSSGILGRCIQCSVTPIVRRSSVAETLALRWTEVISIDHSNPEASSKALLTHSEVCAPVRHDELKAEGDRVQQLLRDFLQGRSR
jgi:hypothetical protein